ncbi:anthranilate phosphoribosyltransferase [Halalkalibacter urbisdiaboli]|uniref:anthranilate phosphoribosyltransferase n=1 Tax=Halalkalibacter urbisdiaboli TaxID=1960589 RepID=UPI0013FDF032|nr:anthranilate phosphoribosyltransferase [Halalkalibacter urbisdiaboli]
MQNWLKEVARGKKNSRDLTYEEAYEAAMDITEGKASSAQIAAFLIAERMKEEAPEELLAFIHAFHEKTNHLNAPIKGMLDCAGPYVGRNSFVATIPVALLLSAIGIPVFLHSSDSLPPKYGSTIKAILEQLGIETMASVEGIERSLSTVQLGFADTEFHCRPLASLREIREEIGVRSLLNTVEKLIRVAQGEAVVLGVFHKTAINNLIPVVRKLPYKQMFIVQGIEGSEDIPVHRHSSFIYKVTEDGEEMLTVRPKDYQLEHQKDKEKEQLTLRQQVSIINEIIVGSENEYLHYFRDQVIFNAGIRLWLLERVSSIEAGIEEARYLLNQGEAKQQLEKWQQQGKVEGKS